MFPNNLYIDNYRLAQHAINYVVAESHKAMLLAGWWDEAGKNPDGSLNVPFSQIGWKLALIHSEISEAMEGFRKDLADDKLPHRKMAEVELADAILRITDLAGALGFNLGAALAEKMAYNAQRDDHKRENRALPGGKKV
jgi:hypothetical protein